MSDLVFRCKFCGEVNSIVEVTLVPRIVSVYPVKWPSGAMTFDYNTGADECFWEAETLLGYACTNDKCTQWNGDLGASGNLSDGNIRITTGITTPEGIATIEEEA